MKHFEIIVNGKSGAVRKGVVAADMVAAIAKAVGLVPDATVADVDRAIFLGLIDAA